MNISNPNLLRIIEDNTVSNFLRCREAGYQVAEARSLMHALPAEAIERGIAGLKRQIEQLRPYLTNRFLPHADNEAVDQLALAMKVKLGRAREKGRGGWDDKNACTQEDLSRMLREHVDKGDPVDVANFCAFLDARGEHILLTPAGSLPHALVMTGCKNEEDLVDMANFGNALMEAVEAHVKHGTLLENWSPADSPAEIVGDLYNRLEESISCHRADLDRLRAAEARISELEALHG